MVETITVAVRGIVLVSNIVMFVFRIGGFKWHIGGRPKRIFGGPLRVVIVLIGEAEVDRMWTFGIGCDFSSFFFMKECISGKPSKCSNKKHISPV